MNARQHLAAVVAAAQQVRDFDGVLAEPVHAAANFLAISELAPSAFQKKLCTGIVARMASQRLPPRGVKRTRAALEMICGAALALEALGAEGEGQLQPLLIVATLVSARGAEVVESIATGKPL